MAFILKEGKTYIDKSNVEHSQVYCVLDSLFFDKGKKKYATIIIYIYKDIDSSNSNSIEPIERYSYTVTGQDLLTYFSTAALSASNSNIWKQGYLYVYSLGSEKAGFNVNDFQSDNGS